MADHAWCRDPAEAAAVRFAEDGRTGPLPTLEEAIAGMFPTKEATVSGLRTERVTLEITHFDDIEADSVRSWNWAEMLSEHGLGINESVRVVEEAVGSVDDRAYADKMSCDEERDFANRILGQRDAAIREREKLCKSWLRSEESGTRLLAERNAALDAADGLRKRVAALEAASGGGEESKEVKNDPTIGQMIEDTCKQLATAMRVADIEKRRGDNLHSRVKALEAASGGEGEPVAWRVEYRGSIEIYSVKQFATGRASEVRGTVVPLYRSPPQPRGWLTGEEREAVESARLHLSNVDGLDEESEQDARWASERVASLLARSTPPEVVLPKLPFTPDSTHAMGWWEAIGKVKKALAAAGVNVKEVGRE